MQKQMLPGDCGNREWPPVPFTPAPCGTRPEGTCPSVDAEKHSVPVFDCSQMVPYTGSRWLNSMVDSSATRLPLRVSQQAGGEKANSDPGCVPWREKLRQACGGSFSRIRVRFKPAGISTSPQSPQRIAEERPPPQSPGFVHSAVPLPRVGYHPGPRGNHSEWDRHSPGEAGRGPAIAACVAIALGGVVRGGFLEEARRDPRPRMSLGWSESGKERGAPPPQQKALESRRFRRLSAAAA